MYLVVEHPDKGCHALDFELIPEEDLYTAILQFTVEFEGFTIKEWDDYSEPEEDVDKNRSRWKYSSDKAKWELWLLPNESLQEKLLSERVANLIRG
jgi:hypothetical protein